MADLDLSNVTTTDFTNEVPDFIVNALALDTISAEGETYWYFQEATQKYGYYKQIPEIYSAANALATWAFGNGWETDDARMKVILNKVSGMGKDTFTKIIYNHEIIKLIVGDAFIEVKRNKNGTLVNMIPISPERVRVVFDRGGMITRYEVWNSRDWRVVKKENMIHSQNKRIGDELHGTSQIDAAKFVIDARNEALADERTIKHRDKALGIAYYDTNNKTKIDDAKSDIHNAVKNGEMLLLPKDTLEIKPYPSRSSEDRQAWIQYLENFFYQVFGVPRSIATSDGTSEVGGKMGNVNFEPTYAKEKNDMEEDLWNQQQIKVSFIKQASLGGLVQQDQTKNSGMTSIQPNDVTANLNRE